MTRQSRLNLLLVICVIAAALASSASSASAQYCTGVFDQPPCTVPSAPGTETVDLIFLIDGSSSTAGQCLFECEQVALHDFILDPARFPLDGSVAIAIIQFTNVCYVELPLTVIDQTNHDQLITCVDRLAQRPHAQNGVVGTHPASAIQQAKYMMDHIAQGNQRLVILSTDAYLRDYDMSEWDAWPATLSAAAELRQSTIPVKVCSVMISQRCDWQDQATIDMTTNMKQVANTLDSINFDPDEPVGITVSGK